MRESDVLSPEIRQAVLYMHDRFTSDVTLSEIADTVGLSQSHFSRIFHKEVGVPFKKYLTGLRIEYAKRLLSDSPLSILDVGFECGFNTPSQFVRAFKASIGISPSDYRKQSNKQK